MSFGAAIAAFFRGYAEFTGTARRSESAAPFGRIRCSARRSAPDAS